MIKPTVGRVVWVRRPFETADPSQPEAGLITYVHGDRKVNVAGFDHDGNPYRVVNVPLLQDDDAKPEGVFACWMPFQVGQAKQQQGQTEMRVNPTVPPAPQT
jgi:hypothetical protein